MKLSRLAPEGFDPYSSTFRYIYIPLGFHPLHYSSQLLIVSSQSTPFHISNSTLRIKVGHYIIRNLFYLLFMYVCVCVCVRVCVRPSVSVHVCAYLILHFDSEKERPLLNVRFFFSESIQDQSTYFVELAEINYVVFMDHDAKKTEGA